jgi:hypothetical protein
MNYEDYRDLIERESAALSQKERVALCLICCARLSPLYSKFVATENWGDASVLAQSRSAAISWLSGNEVDTSPISKQLLHAIPDSEDFGSVISTFAQNAGVAHEYLLEQIKTSEPSPLIYVFHNCYDTVDLYIQELLDPSCLGGFEEVEIEIHEAAVKEINFQCGILKEVRGCKSIADFVGSRSNEPIFKIA